MAQGMWTKRLTSEGKVFYFNATLNKSEWSAPPNCITLEAQHLQIPAKQSAPEEVPRQNNLHYTKDQGMVPAVEVVSQGSVTEVSTAPSNSDLADQLLSSVLVPSVPSGNLDLSTSSQQPPVQPQAPVQRQPRSKRFKSAAKDSSAAPHGAAPSYSEMVSSYQALAGDKGEGGKWLVR